MNEEELLLHYGVKGMKWGVRRARNSVGSATRSIKEYGKVAGTAYKNGIKNPIASDKASLQLMKEKPRTALYRNKEDLKRLNQLTSENVASNKARNAKVVSKAKDYAKVAGTAYKNSMKNPIASDKASLQLMKEKPMTALYRNKNDIKRLNQLTAENVAAKKAKREASKSYKEAKALDKAAKNAKRKETASKIGRELLAISNDVMQDKKMADAIGKIDSSLDKGMADIVRNAMYEETQKRKSDYRTAVGR